MSFLKFSKLFLTVSAVLVVASVGLLITPGPKLSIDFTGGTLLELEFAEASSREQIQSALTEFASEQPLDNSSVSLTREGTAMIRTRFLEPDEHQAVLTHLQERIGPLTERQFTVIGSTVGNTLKQRAIYALLTAAVAIVLYIAFAFRKVPKRLSPWRFGIIAVITLLHDVLITVGIFVLIGQLSGFEVDLLFVTALLTILGYSVNDTIVIFDRIRDNLALGNRNEDFSKVAERSIRQSIARSVNTSVSTLIMLCCLYFFGSESIRWFVLTLIVGAVIGTYSSLCLATPLLVLWRKRTS